MLSCSPAAYRKLVLCSLTFAIALTLAACSGGSGGTTSTPRTLASITVTPADSSVAAGLTQQFKAVGSYSDSSTQDLTSSVSWSSDSASIATIDSSGLATSKAEGTAKITATSGSISGSVTLTVTAPQLVSLSISPSPAKVLIGSAPTQFSATENYTDGSTQDVTASTTWSVSNSWIASMDATGLATINRTGYTNVSAVNGSLSASTGLTVLATPRYLYTSSNTGRDLNRMTVDATSGQPRFAGYRKTGNNLNIFECLTSDPSGTHAYLSSPSYTSSALTTLAEIVDVYNIDSTSGTLTLPATSIQSFSTPVGCITFEPSGKFAYAITEIGNTGDELVTFSVDANGLLTQQSAITLPDQPGGLAIDPLGKFLYVAVEYIGAGDPYAYGYAIDASTGALTPIDGTPFALPAGTYGNFTFDPLGSHVYLSDSASDSITEYTIDRTTGMLTPVDGSTIHPCINPSRLQFTPDGSSAYVTCSMDENRTANSAPLISFSVGADGQLNQIDSVFAGGTSGDMLIDPSGKFIYVPGSGSDFVSISGSTYVANNCVTVFKIGADGKATFAYQIAGRRSQRSLLMLSGPAPVSWTPSHAYIASAGDNSLTSFAVQSDGSLSQLQTMTATATPVSAAMLPWGSDLLVATNASTQNFAAYSVANGTITFGSSAGLASQPGAVAIDPSGMLAFNPDVPTGSVYEYGQYGGAGHWSSLYSPYPTPITYAGGASAGLVTTDPAGRYLIVANSQAKSISFYEYAGAAPITPLSLAYSPLAITVDPAGNWLLVTGDDQNLHLLLSNGMGTFTDSASAQLIGNATSIAIDPSARFVYTSGAAGINAFSIDSQTLALTPISVNLSVSLADATGVYIDPSGKFLYVSVNNNSISALYRFNINSDGSLSSPSTPLVASPKNAVTVLFDSQIQ